MSRANEVKSCGCKAEGLTRALALWACSCGHVQKSPRSARARCAGRLPDGSRCERIKGPNPTGFGCCGNDVPQGDACPSCERHGAAEDMGRLPHPEVEYLTESCRRGNFRARDSFLRCVGCLALVLGTD